jgi:hypothetical protein
VYEDKSELMKAANVETVCTIYADTVRDVSEAFRLLRQGQDRLRAFLEYPHVFPEGSSFYLHDDTAAKAIEHIRRDCWWYVFRKTQIEKLCSVHQRHEFDGMLQRGELPELTMKNVQRLLDNLRAKLPNMLEDAIREVFTFLRPNERWEQFKTNAKYQVGPRVILPYGMETLYGGRFYLSEHRREQLQALDNVMHLLDGQGLARPEGGLVAMIHYAGDQGGRYCQTRYFEVRWFKKGTIHLVFRRQDLLDELNRRGGGEALGEQEKVGTVRTAG